MADNKEYISRAEAEGSVNISEDVISTIAGEAIRGMEGGGGIGSITRREMGKKNVARGVRITVTEDKVTVDAVILVAYGHSVTDTAKQVQASVAKAVGDMTGLTVTAVNVTVSGVVFDKDK